MTKPFLNIFSKKPVIKKEEPKQKIVIDYREKNSLVVTSLKKLGFATELKELKVADYIVNNIAIERKTISDFYSSMINKRLFKQMEEIQQYQDKLLIIEGLENKELYEDYQMNGINPNAIRGLLLSITLRYKVPIIFTRNSFDTAKFIEVLANKKKRESSLNVSKRNLTKKEQKQFILESFSGIGPKNAKKLLEKFQTLKKIFNTPQEELQETIGKKAEIFKLIEEKY